MHNKYSSVLLINVNLSILSSPSDNPRRRRNSTNSDSDNYEDTSDLMDHNDLYVLDLNPTLRSLSMLAVIDNKLDYTCLPASLQ